MKRQDTTAVEGDFLSLSDFRRFLVPPTPVIPAPKPDDAKAKINNAKAKTKQIAGSKPKLKALTKDTNS